MGDVDCTEESKLGFVGSWDSFNVADVHIEGEEATIKLNTTVLIEMNSQSDEQGAVDLTGFLKKTVLTSLNQENRETQVRQGKIGRHHRSFRRIGLRPVDNHASTFVGDLHRQDQRSDLHYKIRVHR